MSLVIIHKKHAKSTLKSIKKGKEKGKNIKIMLKSNPKPGKKLQEKTHVFCSQNLKLK